MIRYTDDFHPSDNYKWTILNQEKAEEYHIGLIELDGRRKENLLTINTEYIPQGMSSEEFLQFLQDSKIVMNNIKKQENKKKSHK